MYISQPSLHDYDMELFNIMFCGTYAPCKRTQHGWPTTPNLVGCYMLRPFAHPVACCWMLLLFSQQLPTFLLFHDPNARLLRMDYKDLWVVFFLQCTAGPKLVGSCCIHLHTTTNTHATTPNIVGATVLGVVAPVCTQPNVKRPTAPSGTVPPITFRGYKVWLMNGPFTVMDGSEAGGDLVLIETLKFLLYYVS